MKALRVSLAVAAVVTVALLAFGLHAAPPKHQRDSVMKTVKYGGDAFDVVVLEPKAWRVRIDWMDGGTRLSQVQGAVRTNAGIFEPGFVPTGLLVSDGVTKRPLNTASGNGNFFLLPNGVFTLDAEGNARVLETSEYEPKGVVFATQSGPLLLRRGVVHPKFSASSSNKALRSGVGVRSDGAVVLAISQGEVTLHSFATTFRDALACPDALYLDGVISAFWAEGSGRASDLDDKGPFAGVITATTR